MGKITKKPQEKHNASLSPAVLDLVKKVSDAPLADLPALFNSWDRRWPYPRGDLMNWVAPLDRFDDIFDSFIRKYGLHQGPQTTPFGVAILVEGSPGSSEQQIKDEFGDDGDRVLIESILEFSRLLVEKCANRNTYSSTDRLNDLLNTTSLSLLHRTLRLTVFLAQRYSERAASLPAPSIKFYDFDQDRLRCLASPIAQNLMQAKRAPASPVKSAKSRPGQSTRPRRASSVANPDDFRSLCRNSPSKDDSKPTQPDRDWLSWAHVKVVWSSETTTKQADDSDQTNPLSPAPSAPSTPTPLRRQTSASTRSPQVNDAVLAASTSEASIRSVEYGPSDLSKLTIEEALLRCPEDMPQPARYELLHKLRIAYGLVASPASRKEVLAVRILAIDVVGSIFSDEELQRNVLGKDQAAQKPQELIQQLVNLIQDAKKGQSAVDLYMQTLGMETVSVLARHKPFGQDIAAALGASSANGLMLRLTQRALADLANDGDDTDTFDGDEWREAVFSLPLHVIETSGNHGRVSEPIFSGSFVAAYVTGLQHMTIKAMRVHLRILDFIKSFFHHFKDGIQVLLQTEAFDIVCNLTRNIAEDAWQQHQAGKGLPAEYKTRLTDYEIPYIHRQVLRSIIDMINDITGHQGANADRASRSLVDSQPLLSAFKLIMDKLDAFGTHTWSEVVKAICGFLNNEPTCFTVIAESGIIKSFLQTVTRREGLPPDAVNGHKISSISQQDGPGIPASIEAIVNASQLFEAICLTAAGFDLFKTSGALEKFFELFESPAHIKLMRDQTNMRTLGSTFDELVRHHPNLRPTVMSSVIVMIARVRHITRTMAGDFGAGPRMWLQNGADDKLTVSGGDEALRQEIIPPARPDPPSAKEITLPDSKILNLEDGQYHGLLCDHPQNEDSHGLTASDYMRPAVGFLAHLFRTQSLCTYFLDHGAADIVLDFITIPSVPVAEYSFGMHGHMEELANVVHMMAELKPGLILPALVDRALYICKELDNFSHSNPGRDQSYFTPLIQQKTEERQQSAMEVTSPVEQQGTYLVRCMMAIYCLAQVIGEVFSTPMYNPRAPNAFLFGAVNIADLLGELCDSLGRISASCVREALAIQKSVPESWVKATKPESFSMGDDEVDQILRIWDNSSTSSSEEDTPEIAKARTTAAFKNVQTLRYLTLETPAAIAELLGSIGHGIAGSRKRPDTFSRQKSAVVADAIAKALFYQLQPSFLDTKLSNVSVDKETKFQYLVVCLTNMRASLHDDLQGAGTGEFCQSYVVNSLKQMGGLRRLRDIGAEFFSELKQCKVEQWTFAANTGLKTCLDIFDIFTGAKTVASAPQSNHMKNSDPSKAHYFVPAQSLLEFRMEVLPLVREIWTSDYADQASRDVIQKMVSILKHILKGDHEEDAIKITSAYPKLTPPAPRTFVYDNQRLRELKGEGFEEDLVKEALYRTNAGQTSQQSSAAREYCQAILANPRRRRLPPPSNTSEVAATARETPVGSSPVGAPSQLPIGPIEDALTQIMNNTSEDSEMEGVTATGNQDSTRPPTSGSSAMDLSNILNHSDEPPVNASAASDRAEPHVSVETINGERASIREDLAERCNNVLNNHSDMVFDLSDLISSATQKLSQEDTKLFWESTSDLLVNSLLSMQADDEIAEAEGKKIAAAAHLIALLVNDKDVFKIALEVFQDNFESMLSFLKLSTNVARKPDDAYPWVGPILLLIEQMLSQDSEPAEVRWEYPRDLDSEIPKAVLIETTTVPVEQKKELFAVLLDCLPRVGKDKAMALSITRVLVMLTRKREIATMLAEKRNLQRLFLMVKQLGSGGSKAFLSSFMLVLRHVIEDEETLKQIMRSEIQIALTGRNAPPTRTLDINAYTRELAHLVIRSPGIFVQLSNEMLKLGSWQPHSPGSQLVLKDSPKPPDVQQEEASEGEITQDPSNQATASVEDADNQPDESKGKAADIKPPVVENPDGVIHFLLSELLSYKDVEDKDVPSSARSDPDASSSAILDAPVAPTVAPESTASSGDESPVGQSNPSKPERPRFKQEEHPIFIYRCFLLQCLVELLHSYNRTKVELINFSRKADPMAVTPSKPRSGVLNYLLGGLVASGYIDKDDQSVHCKKRLAVSDWAIKVVVALCSKTGEKGRSAPAQRYSLVQVDDKDDEPELTFVRRFVLEHAIRAFKDATASAESVQHKYSKLLCLSDLFNRLLSKPASSDGAAGSNNNSYKVLGRMMFEKNLISVLTSSLAEIDLSQQGAKRVIKFILRPLQELTTLATALSLSSPEVITSVLGSTSDDDISSASSVSEVEDEREETPDLYRNSALGLLDPNRSQGSDSDSDDDEEDEEMYDDEEYPDEMDYDDMPPGQEDDEAVSDDDEEADLDGPIEGMPGDVPMELEFVVNDGGMEVDTGDDDTEDDSDSEESDTDEEEDFEIGEDADEINGDNENDSLNDGDDHEGEWENEEGDNEDADVDDADEIEVEMDGDLIGDGQEAPALQDDLNTLLRVLNGQDEDGDHVAHTHIVMHPAAHGDDNDDEGGDADGADDDEEMDDNDALGHDHFDDFMEGDIEDDYYDDQWVFEEPTSRPSRGFGRRNFGGRSVFRPPPPPFFPPGFREAGDPVPPFYRTSGGRRTGRQDQDDGTNPLLQRPIGDSQAPAHRPGDFQRVGMMPIPRVDDEDSEAFNSFANLMPGPVREAFRSVIQAEGGHSRGHGQLLDLIANSIHRGSPGGLMHPGQPVSINLSVPLADLPSAMRPPYRIGGQLPGSRVREDPPRAVNFTPATTMTRWKEEQSIIFNNQYLDKVQRVQILLMSLLAPAAQQEEKERRRKREEELKAREEEEKQRAEATRLRKEHEEREAAERAEEERRLAVEAEATAAAAAAATQSATDPVVDDATETEPMEGVQSTDTGPRSQEQQDDGEPSEPAQERVFTTIRGRQLDITGLAIDREYLEALPEDLREEVIMQQYATRRDEAQQQSATSGAATGSGAAATADAAGIDPEYLNDFLNALPEEVREEIRQSEANAQLQRQRASARREATATAGRPAQADDMNNDDFLATLDPALRREILGEQSHDILAQLNPRFAAEGREHARRIFHYSGLPIGRQADGGRPDREGQRDNKRQVVQLVDKAGVATLLRLMFLPQGGSLRSNLGHILRNVCGNRVTRFEVINMLLVILREGSTDVTAVEKSLASLSLRAKATSAQKTPQPLKRTLSLQPNAGLSEDITPLIVVQQCLSALKQLSQHGFHVRTLFLREVDVSSSAKSKKGKDKESKTTKYPINDLITLLDRELIVKSAPSLQSLAELLATVTSPLVVLMRKEKGQQKPAEKKTDGNDTSTTPEQPTTTAEGQPEDATMEETSILAAAEEAGVAALAEGEQAPADKEEGAEPGKPEEPKPKKSFDPPVIPARNLQLIVDIFVAPECGNDTFHATLDTMSSIASIPGTSEIFGKQLIGHVKKLSQSLTSSLDELLPQLREAQSSTELHGIASSHFSHSGSDQVKLLHVLKALDYLSGPEKDGETDKAAVKSILTASYEELSLGPLWSKLGESLAVMGEKDNVIAFATILLPLIESLMVVCKNTSLKEAPLSQQLREDGPTTPMVEDLNDLEKLFFEFTTQHRKILNDIIRQSPKLMQGNGSFSLLAKNPKVLDFDNKRAFFTKQIHSRLHQQRHVQPPLQLNVRREQVFQDSYKALYFKSADEMKYGKLNIRFNGEEGVDAGGVTREWFQVLARGIFNPDWALWQPVASDKTTFHPNSLSWINGEHLVYFKFIGRIIGKALHESRVLDCHFSRAVYKRMLGKQPNLKDLESMDLDYYKSLVWILENDITEVLTEDFSVVEEQFGEEKVVDLIPDGRTIPVTEDNKREYVQKLVEYRLTGSVSEQLDHFIRGFHDIIPAELVAIFDEQELELLISGLPEIDVDDWKANTDYHNYNANSPQVQWFWRIVRAMSNEERAKLLQFITGTSKVPLNGFKDLEGMQGTTCFSIHREPNLNRLPTSHTCFNQLDLPAYDNQESLKTNIMKAINLGADYFGFA